MAKKAAYTLLREFHGNTKPAEEFGYQRDAKRLRSEFGDNVRLRWHPRKQRCQVWHRTPNECMLVYEISAPYDIWKAIRHLMHVQRSRKAHMDEWQIHEMMEEHDKKRRVRAVAEEVGNAYKNAMNSKVSVLMR
jgi:hypothetical protein